MTKNTELLKKEMEANYDEWHTLLMNKEYKQLIETAKAMCSKYGFDNTIFSEYDRFKYIRLYNNDVAETCGLNYINASFVERFIACQEPYHQYRDHFHTFLNNAGIELIVSLIHDPCYFDNRDLVKIIEENEVFEMAEFRLKNRTIHRLRVKIWKDHHALTPSELERIYRYLVHNCGAFLKAKKTVIHCLAGVGRTGTFITYVTLMEMKRKVSSREFLDLFMRVRRQRQYAIDNERQMEMLVELFVTE